MRALHIHLDGDPANEGIAWGLDRAGFTTHTVPWRSFAKAYGFTALRAHVQQLARDLQPDLIFCQLQRPGVLDQDTVRALRDTGAFVVNFTGDARENVAWFEDMADAFSITLFTNESDPKRITRGPAGFLRMGYDPRLFKPEGMAIPQPEVIFLANNHGSAFPKSEERQDLVATLARELGPRRFAVYGTGWHKLAGRCHRNPVHASQAARVLRGARIVIAHSQFALERCTSARLPITMACGALAMAQVYPGMGKDFAPGQHLCTWQHPHDLLEDIDRLLSFPDSCRTIARQGAEHVRNTWAWDRVALDLRNMIPTPPKP